MATNKKITEVNSLRVLVCVLRTIKYHPLMVFTHILHMKYCNQNVGLATYPCHSHVICGAGKKQEVSIIHIKKNSLDDFKYKYHSK